MNYSPSRLFADVFSLVLLTAFLATPVGMLASSPDTIPAAIGGMYVDICLSTGRCDLAALNGGLAIAVLVLVSLFMVVLRVADWRTYYNEDDTETDMYTMLEALYEKMLDDDEKERRLNHTPNRFERWVSALDDRYRAWTESLALPVWARMVVYLIPRLLLVSAFGAALIMLPIAVWMAIPG